MRVALMVPCYIDMFYPQVGKSTLGLLERLGVQVDYPFDQTCCGQPMANSGAHTESAATEELFVRNFADYDYIVAPSGSCVHHVRNKFTAAEDTAQRRRVSSHIWDLPEFLCDVLKVEAFPWARFPHQVALHVSCSAIRGLNQQSMSERPNDPWFSKPRTTSRVSARRLRRVALGALRLRRHRRYHCPPRPGRHHPHRGAGTAPRKRHRRAVTGLIVFDHGLARVDRPADMEHSFAAMSASRGTQRWPDGLQRQR